MLVLIQVRGHKPRGEALASDPPFSTQHFPCFPIIGLSSLNVKPVLKVQEPWLGLVDPCRTLEHELLQNWSHSLASCWSFLVPCQLLKTAPGGVCVCVTWPQKGRAENSERPALPTAWSQCIGLEEWVWWGHNSVLCREEIQLRIYSIIYYV